jgi:hypothetical protein
MMNSFRKREKGQILVIVAAAMLVLLVVIGLAIDGTQLFLNYTRLKRAVDAAAVGAANDFKKGKTVPDMKKSALELLDLHGLDLSVINLEVFICDANGDGVRDASLQATVPDFYAACPATGLQKKLVYVRAFQNSPTYFLSLIGIYDVPITTTAIAEAAPIDLVIVLDTSESMGKDTTGYSAADFNPAACNANNSCQPLKQAKDAAKALIDTLYQGYDRVAVVNFDVEAYVAFPLGGDLNAAKSAIDNSVLLHDDPPMNKLFPKWYNNGTGGKVNPVNPEDRDNNGSDADPNYPANPTVCTPGPDRWDNTLNIPCDDPNYFDAFDWNGDGIFTIEDHNASVKWMQDHDILGAAHTPHPPMSLVSTCSGCGIRVANEQLVSSARSNAVWVMVFLSDGVANMSDTPRTYPYNASTKLGIPNIYPNGFCGGGIDSGFWPSLCIDKDTSIRYCINDDPDTCPPGSYALAKAGSGFSPPYSPPYSVEDYARDMTDMAALTWSKNPKEKRGNDMAIYTIGFGNAVVPYGEPLLRYMAAVGDDGNRETDPCKDVNGIPLASKKSCGQYYFAPTGNDLLPIFENIASRIYTKISE